MKINKKSLLVTGGVLTAIVAISLIAMSIIAVFAPAMFIDKSKIIEVQERFASKHEWLSINNVSDNIDVTYKSGILFKPHYLVEIKDTSVSVDLQSFAEAFKDLKLPENVVIPKVNLKGNVGKVVFLYGPIDKYLDLVSIDNFDVKNVFEEDPFVFNIASIFSEGVILSSFLTDDDSKPSKTIELKDKLSLKLTDANIESKEFNMAVDLLNFQQSLSPEGKFDYSKLDVQSVSGNLNNAKISLLYDNEPMESTLDTASFNLDFTPAKEEGLINVFFKVNVKDFLNNTGKKLFIGDLTLLQGKFGMNNVSDQILKSLGGFSNIKPKDTQYGQKDYSDIIAQTKDLFGSIKKVKPEITFEISPVKHTLGIADLVGNISYSEKGLTGKAVVISTNLAEIKKQLLVNSPLKEADVSKVFETLDKFFITKEFGESELNLTVRPRMPFLYINEKPITSFIDANTFKRK